ncbi:MAG: hypothetical protein V3V00_16015 [Saprospiraceae bacterium]
MAQNYTTIDTGIKSMVMSLTGFTNDFVLKANQNSPRPELPFITFQRIAERKMHRNFTIDPTATEDAKIVNVKRLTTRFIAYTADQTSQDVLDNLILGFDNEPVMDTVRTTYGISTLNYGPATDIPGITTNVFEDRTFVDVTILYNSTLVLNDPSTIGEFIEDLNGSGTLKDLKTGDKIVTFSVDT